MSAIDIQNSRQIRDPMDVLITMTLADDDISMTYSGYSSAKVADGVLNQRNWSMRKLADLQGDGFPLDGAHVLYDSATAPSQANGKLGVRSNVGESVSVTARGNKTMASIGISVTGAESVELNGDTTPIPGSFVTLPLLSTTATLVFNPANETERVEISVIEPKADFKITNESLIRATVSLRSDLSILNQSLPESEINIEAYFEEDVSQTVATIPEEVPIIYRAGYDGDMSPERKFYVSGQVTWADHVLSIHGVDAVHLLDKTQLYPIYVGWQPAKVTEDFAGKSTLNTLNDCIRGVLNEAGISYNEVTEFFRDRGTNNFVVKEQTARDFIANVMWLFHLNLSGTKIGRRTDGYWVTYVDAGIPTLTDIKPTTKWTISEDDVADYKKNVETPYKYIGYNYNALVNSVPETGGRSAIVGSGDWSYGNGAFISIDEYTYNFVARYNSQAIDSVSSENPTGWVAIAPRFNTYCVRLFGGNVPHSWATPIYTQVMPWTTGNRNTSQEYVWNESGESKDNTLQLELTGQKFLKDDTRIGVGITIEGKTLELVIEAFDGEISSQGDGGGAEKWFPNMSLTEIIRRAYYSNVSGSFTWKGDPRMQPRDVVTFQRLDGTAEEITLENITLTHENGGTSAEITYRKGIV